MSVKKLWESYEEVATHLLNRFADHFGLECVEGKQCVAGTSGAEWEIDAKGVSENGEGFLMIECRRYTQSRLNQESLAALAFRIQDAGAKGGIVVTPLDLQSGAKKVAAHTNIQHIILDHKSTTSKYVLRFLKKIFIGVEVPLAVSCTASAHVISAAKLEAVPASEREKFLRNKFLRNKITNHAHN
ncbi:MAG: hypothetical protein D3924_15435 [Candidatus Electrothrix sp. AR4]|nr:hypothetical protein [Candidatus Electrothrix sp. AR4]